MSGFDLPPIRGFDQSFQKPAQPFVSPEVQGPEPHKPRERAPCALC